MGGNIHHFLLDHRIGGPHRYVQVIKDIGGKLRYKTVIYTTKRGEITDIDLVNFRHKSFLLYPLEVVSNVFIILKIFIKKIDI